ELFYSYNSSWFLSKITSPSGSVVDFVYDAVTPMDYPIGIVETKYSKIGGPGYKHDVRCVNYSSIISGFRLRKILFRSGEIEFVPEQGTRLDLPGDKRLETIIVKDYKLNTIRKFNLGYQYM